MSNHGDISWNNQSSLSRQKMRDESSWWKDHPQGSKGATWHDGSWIFTSRIILVMITCNTTGFYVYDTYIYIYYNYTQYMFFIDIYLYTICHRHVYEKLGKVRHLKWWCKKWWALESLKIANLDDIELAKKLHMDIWHMGKTLVWDEFPSILCLMGKNRPSYTRCYSPVIYKLVYNPH
jgi:hypothetical protein